MSSHTLLINRLGCPFLHPQSLFVSYSLTMKLRLRSIESKETLKIEAGDSISLTQLKQILADKLSDSPPPSSIHLSLNRKDRLQSTSADGEDSLRFHGISAGDLIYFSIDTNSLQGFPSVSRRSTGTNSRSQSIASLEPDVGALKSESINYGSSSTQNSQSDSCDVDLDSLNRKIDDKGNQNTETSDCMEVDDGNGIFLEDNMKSEELAEGSFSLPGFLREVLSEELSDDGGRHHKLTMVAIHAIFLESGFVGFDPILNIEMKGFPVKNNSPSNGFTSPIFYTLPEIIGSGRDNVVETVKLKFQNLGKFIFVYGSLGNESVTEVHSVRLDEDLLVPLLNVIWANSGVTENLYGNGDFTDTSPEKELFKFWRNAKDNLVLPLLIELCEKAGFQLPPCFMRMPIDIKMKILEFLPGVDLAKVTCVSSELKYLASNDELWMMKLKEQYGSVISKGTSKWKSLFAECWEKEKHSIRRGCAVRELIRHPYPFMIPRGLRIIGGNHDIWPGGDSSARLRDPINRLMRRNVSPYSFLRGGQFL